MVLQEARKELARNYLIDFTQYTFPSYIAEPAHCLLASKLDEVVAGKCKRLMVFFGPQHGKSHLTSVEFPAYWLARRPEDPIILTSYAALLAESKSRQARAIVESAEFAELFPHIKTSDESRSVSHWNLAGHRGSLLAAGVGGGITGHGTACALIDDPVENWEAAQSQILRDKAYDWYRNTFRTRVWEGGAIVIVMTRWNEDDLAGRLLRDQPGLWEVIRLPAIAETQEERDLSNRLLGLPAGQSDPLGRQAGEALCPRRFSLAALESIKRDVGSIGWAAQYQGVPRAPEGNRFKRAWFKEIAEIPKGCSFVRYWDKAGTAGDGCYTVGLLMARTLDGLYIICDIVRGQWSAFDRKRIMVTTAQKDEETYGGQVDQWVEREPADSGKEAAEDDVRMLAGYRVYVDKASKNKEIRAEPLAAQAEAGNVRIKKDSWNEAYIDEMTVFPNGMLKDQVDASSGAFNKLANGGKSEVPTYVPLGGPSEQKLAKAMGEVSRSRLDVALGQTTKADGYQRRGMFGQRERFRR